MTWRGRILAIALIVFLCLQAAQAVTEDSPSESKSLLKLRELEDEDGVIDLSRDDALITKLLFHGPRDYTVILSISSATERLKCDVCFLWNPTFAKVARTHAKMEKRKPNLFFVKIDIGFTSNELRQKLANKIRGLPFVSVLPKTPVKSTRFDVEEKNSYYNILDGDVAFAVWVNGKADVHIRIIDYKRITLFSIGIIMIGIFVYVKFDWLWKLAHNPMTYFVASLAGYCIVAGGTVFSYIHKTPFFAMDRSGEAHWIMPGAREQLGAEAIIMAFILGGGSLGWVILTGIMPNSKRPKSVALVVLAITFILMLIGRRLFQWKHPYYPY